MIEAALQGGSSGDPHRGLPISCDHELGRTRTVELAEELEPLRAHDNLMVLRVS
ncbi:MAG TPA: hypothetical protein VHN14_25680 [Kofleriaceae bacterium]|nr:hypothetical protein [Kofleriaceae bacterium]